MVITSSITKSLVMFISLMVINMPVFAESWFGNFKPSRVHKLDDSYSTKIPNRGGGLPHAVCLTQGQYFIFIGWGEALTSRDGRQWHTSTTPMKDLVFRQMSCQKNAAFFFASPEVFVYEKNQWRTIASIDAAFIPRIDYDGSISAVGEIHKISELNIKNPMIKLFDGNNVFVAKKTYKSTVASFYVDENLLSVKTGRNEVIFEFDSNKGYPYYVNIQDQDIILDQVKCSKKQTRDSDCLELKAYQILESGKLGQLKINGTFHQYIINRDWFGNCRRLSNQLTSCGLDTPEIKSFKEISMMTYIEGKGLFIKPLKPHDYRPENDAFSFLGDSIAVSYASDRMLVSAIRLDKKKMYGEIVEFKYDDIVKQILRPYQ